MTKPADYMAVLQARYDELAAKKAGNPYSDAVIQCCDMYLRWNKTPTWINRNSFTEKPE